MTPPILRTARAATPWPARLLVTTAVLTLTLAAQEPTGELPYLDAATRVFASLTAKEQQAVLTAVQAAAATVAMEDRKGLHAFADAARRPTTPRLPHTPARGKESETAARAAQGTLDGLPFPVATAYRFGSGSIGPRHGKLTGDKAEAKARAAALDTALRGLPAEADLTFAGLLQALDQDRRADAFAHLLETWRNGAETFYEALERTAGGSDGLFYYDAMFADWQKACVPKNHPDRKRLLASSDAACSGFQAAFRNYWRHRSQIEAMAATLLLGADAPLPANLARFDDKAGADHSLHECMLLVLAAHDGDVTAVVRAYLAAMPPLPEPLWTGDHDAFGAMQRLFQASMPRMLQRASSTDELLGRLRQTSRDVTRRRGQAAWLAFQGALPAAALARLGPFARP